MPASRAEYNNLLVSVTRMTDCATDAAIERKLTRTVLDRCLHERVGGRLDESLDRCFHERIDERPDESRRQAQGRLLRLFDKRGR